MDEFNKGNTSAAAGKQGWAELFHTRTDIKLVYQITLNYKIFWNTSFCSPCKREVFTITPFPKKKHETESP